MVPVEEYLHTSYLDGDREYLDGVIVRRNLGTPDHSALQMIVIAHLAAFEESLQIAVRPEWSKKISETRYRVPDILVMKRPFRQSKRALLDPPLIIVEIVSPDDRVRQTMQRFRDYQTLGVRHIIQMDPADRTTFVFSNGDLIRRDLTTLEVSDHGQLPFDSRELLARLDEE